MQKKHANSEFVHFLHTPLKNDGWNTGMANFHRLC